MANRLFKDKKYFLKLVSIQPDKEFDSASGRKCQYKTVWEDDKTEQYYGEYCVSCGTPIDDIIVGKKYAFEVTREGKFTDEIKIIGIEEHRNFVPTTHTSELPRANALTMDALMGYRRSALNIASQIIIRELDIDNPAFTLEKEREMYALSERILGYIQTGDIEVKPDLSF